MKEEDKDLQPLLKKEILAELKNLPDWKYKNNKISKEFQFDSISAGLKLLNQLIPYCNRIDHHPDIHIYFRKFVFELTRHSIGTKVVGRDFTVARKIEKLYKKQKKT